jgi:hypothetical protein
MKLAIVYIYAPCAGAAYDSYAVRFLQSYHDNQPGMEHDSVVVVNGAKANGELACMFSSLPNLRLIEHDNSGYDIGGFQLAAREHACDLMVFFGASTTYTRPGWLTRMAASYSIHGPGQYGAMGNRGDIPVKVWPHIRTTAFWMHPSLMCGYPQRITRPEQRHPFEHGPNCFTGWVTSQGLKSWVITWNRDLLWADWDSDPTGYQRGDQSGLLAKDHLCEPPYYPRGR